MALRFHLFPALARLVGAAAVVMAIGFVAAAGGRAAEPARVEPLAVETAKGSFTFAVEIADTPELRRRGLMFRHRLPDDRGMLFDWGAVGPVSMWMRNTYVSLDMVFIASNGRVVGVVERTVPLSETIISSPEPVAGVLELAAGTAERIGLKPGDRVVHPRFVGQP